MKKNVFSRTIAVLASMTVLGTASMLSASAKGIKVDTVPVDLTDVTTDTVKVKVPVYMDDIQSGGGKFVFTADAPEIISAKGSGMVSTGDIKSGLEIVYVSGEPYALDEPIDTLTVEFDAKAEPGSYAINVSITQMDDNGTTVTEGVTGTAGAIVVPEPATEPETTEAATEAPTTAAPTTAAATTTTAKPNSSPKTGSTGVAVAVAGLVTAGATAVVLKKKH